jgi:hypothetical protein
VIRERQPIRIARSPLSALGFVLVSAGFTCVCWYVIAEAPGEIFGLGYERFAGQSRCISRKVNDADHVIITRPVSASMPVMNRIGPVG